MAYYNNNERAREEEIRQMRERALRILLTPEARQRLNNLKMVRPELVSSVEDYIITMGSQGRINRALTDEELKKILLQIQSSRRDFKINFRR
jgi:programmed cell death protein 5